MKNKITFLDTEQRIQVQNSISLLSGEDTIDEGRIERRKDDALYVNVKCLPVDKYSPDVFFRFTPTGYYTRNSNEQIYISNIRINGQFTGSVFIETLYKLLNRAVSKFTLAYSQEEKDKLKSFCVQNNILNYDSILNNAKLSDAVIKVPSSATMVNTQYVANGLAGTILLPSNLSGVNIVQNINSVLCNSSARARNKIIKGDTGNGCIKLENGQILFNTGLLDTLLNPILGITTETVNDGAVLMRIVTKQEELVSMGLTQQDISEVMNCKNYYGALEDLSSIESMLMDNYNPSGCYHLIEDRPERFGKVYQDMPSEVLSALVSAAIGKAVRMWRYNKLYIRPIYSGESDKVSYAVPLHLLKSIKAPPELFAIVTELKGVWRVATVLDTQSILIRTWAFEPYLETLQNTCT